MRAVRYAFLLCLSLCSIRSTRNFIAEDSKIGRCNSSKAIKELVRNWGQVHEYHDKRCSAKRHIVLMRLDLTYQPFDLETNRLMKFETAFISMIMSRAHSSNGQQLLQSN